MAQPPKCIINENGLTMYDNGYIAIDTHLWTTQAKLAKKLGVSRNVINNRVHRYMKNGTLRTYYIEQLENRLIPNVNSLNELGGSQKKL